MIFGAGWVTCWFSASSGKDKVVEACDPEHGVVDTFAFQSAVAEDLPSLHAG